MVQFTFNLNLESSKDKTTSVVNNVGRDLASRKENSNTQIDVSKNYRQLRYFQYVQRPLSHEK